MGEYRHRMGATADFRRDLEDLVCGHLGGCLSPPSSSCSGLGSGGVTAHGPDEAESSAARRRRRESRLLSRWVARQAEEVLSSMEREVERRNRQAELLAVARLHPVSTLDPSSFLPSPTVPPPSPAPSPAAPPSLLQMWRELELRRTDADQPFDREPLPDTTDHRVRQIARRLTDANGGATAGATATGEWLGETERQRVRLVRERVQMASQPRVSRAASRRDEPAPAAAADRDRHREPPRLRGRQVRMDVITWMARERQHELQGISGYHIVSEFPRRSRNHIQVTARCYHAARTISPLCCHEC
jgi:hypothetical protein